MPPRRAKTRKTARDLKYLRPLTSSKITEDKLWISSWVKNSLAVTP